MWVGPMLLLIAFPALLQSALRTRRASREVLQNIQFLLNEQVQRKIVQDDATFLADEALPVVRRRNPDMGHSYSELDVNNVDDFFQGDVELSEEQAKMLQEQLLLTSDKSNFHSRRKRKIGREPIYRRWIRDRAISYDFAESIPWPTRVKIRKALDIWEHGTCLRFVEHGPDVDRLEFFEGGGCSSFVGRAGGTQGISISTPGCDHIGIIAHEIGHAIGTFHEQARPDQHSHLAIHYSNIPIARWNNFHPMVESQAETFALPFDAGSVMMYGPYGFAADPFRPTISTLDRNYQSTIGQRAAGPSFLDIQAINAAYSCQDRCNGTRPSRPCTHGGYVDSKYCTKCICPDGFAGDYCDDVEPTPCGKVVEVVADYSVFIGNPNYPAHFGTAEEKCIWLLRASEPSAQIYLEFVESFHYQCEDTCDKAYVELKTGSDFRPTGYRFCCSSAPAQRFKSSLNEMLVIHSGRGEPSGRFKARVWAAKSGSTLSPPPPPQISSTSTEGLPSTTTEAATVLSRATTLASLTTTTTNTTRGLIPYLPTVTETAIESSSSLTTSTTRPTSPSPLPRNHSTSTTLSTLFPQQTTRSPVIITEPIDGCHCTEWTEWSGCSQVCGGCGRRTRLRNCAPPERACQREEKRACNFRACPQGTNFILNNSEFYFLWKGCCVGLFNNNEQCSALDNGGSALLKLFSSLLTVRDAKDRGKNSSILQIHT